MKKYSVAEIDDLRVVCGLRYIWGTSEPSHSGMTTSRQYSEIDKIKAVEETVRTYMIAGIKADEIRKEDADAFGVSKPICLLIEQTMT